MFQKQIAFVEHTVLSFSAEMISPSTTGRQTASQFLPPNNNSADASSGHQASYHLSQPSYIESMALVLLVFCIVLLFFPILEVYEVKGRLLVAKKKGRVTVSLLIYLPIVWKGVTKFKLPSFILLRCFKKNMSWYNNLCSRRFQICYN